MRKIVPLAVLLMTWLAPSTLASSPVALKASPNPAMLGDRVVHTIELGAPARLDVWVSAQGFAQPGTGTLPPGAWRKECCPSQTAGTAAWHFRSYSVAPAGTYRFGAGARAVGVYLSTAAAGSASASVWIRVT